MGIKENKIDTVMVVGAGIMGHGIAQFIAYNDTQVILVDNDESKLAQGLSWINDNLNYMIELGILR